MQASAAMVTRTSSVITRSAAALEPLLGQEDLDAPLELALVLLGQAAVESDVAAPGCRASGREWLRQEPSAPPVLQESEHAQPFSLGKDSPILVR